ncbi:L-rhamnose mutarotase [Nonomuraea sp. NPDC050310]|uniref:L-rhamnose mutarotase n=1 Tax=unclassified Nonomuraea TaxID=2593643 RepID=UPI0033F70523
MQRLAIRTRLKPGCEEIYDREHAVVPADLDEALRRHGVHVWRIWRDGLDLFHYVEVEDWAAFQAGMKHEPADIAWQRQMNRLLDGDFDQESTGLRQVWELG